MNRRSRITAAAPAALLALAASCNDPNTVAVTELNLDRPVDIAFACYGDLNVTATGDPLVGTTIKTAQPTSWCEARSPQITGTAPVPTGQNASSVLFWYGFILQSASGTVAMAKWTVTSSLDFTNNSNTEFRVLDADPLTPGKNAISVGEDPVAIATDASGCYEVVANAGSCDLSVLDASSAIAVADGQSTGAIRVDRIAVNDSQNHPMRAKPAAMVGPPSDPLATDTAGKSCRRTAADGLLPSGKFYIAYPSCHLVAAVETTDGISGQIVAGIQYTDATSVPVLLTGDALHSVVDACPDECNGAIDATPTVPRPVALDLKLEDRPEITSSSPPTERLAIGSSNSSRLTIVALEPAMSPATSLPSAVSQIQLEDKTGKLGLTSVSISPRIGMGGTSGILDDTQGPGGPSQFVYAVANDKSVRVASLQIPNATNVPTECDTEVDMRFVRNLPNHGSQDASVLKCFAVGDPATPPRRLGAHSPGIELPDSSVPTSVTIFQGRKDKKADTTGTVDVADTALTLVGYFAAISTTSGRVFIANVDDDNSRDFADFGLSPYGFDSQVLHIPHQLRDSYGSASMRDRSTPARTCADIDPTFLAGTTVTTSTTDGAPRSSGVPVRNLPSNTVPTGASVEMPALRQLTCTDKDEGGNVTAVSMVSQLELAAGIADQPPDIPSTQNVLDNTYPDLRNAPNQGWYLTWEGPLAAAASVNSTVDGPQIRTGQIKVDSTGMRITDPARAFCEMGVEPFDIVQFHGCNPANGDAECPSGYTCYVHPRSKVAGIGNCMAANEADRLATACFDFLTTDRRYTVGSAGPGQLQLLPRKHELYATPIAGCTDDQQCNAIAQYASNNNLAADPFIPVDATDPKKPHTEWSCRIDDARKPLNDDPAAKRCVQTCAFHSSSGALKAAGDPSYDGLDRDTDCTPGSICVGATYSATQDPASRGVCMESVEPPQACVNGPQQFDVRATEAFTVIGTTTGYIHPVVAQGESCVVDPTANRLEIGRIPLTAPACDPTADPITGQLPSGGFEPNPCSLTLQQTDVQNNYVAGTTCVLDTTTPSTIITRQASAIKFSNPAMTIDLVDPTYPGDKACIQDRQGPFTGVSFIPPGATPTATGYQLTFDQKAGYNPMTSSLPAAAAFPSKLVRGPTQSIWVLDSGDVLTTSPATAGQVFRIESIDINAVKVLQ